MRTSLRDVGAALTVITPEFRRDLADTSFDQALLYTPLKGDEYWDIGAMLSYQRRICQKYNLRVQLNVQPGATLPCSPTPTARSRRCWPPCGI